MSPTNNPLRIFYSSYVDLAEPYGPAVNETMFIKNMLQRADVDFHWCIPAPSGRAPITADGSSVEYFTRGGFGRSVLGWLSTRLLSGRRLSRGIRECRPELIVLRSGSVPLSQYIAVRSTGVPYVIKTAGDGSRWSGRGIPVIARVVGMIDRVVRGRLYSGAKFIDVVSEQHRRGLLERGLVTEERVAVLDNGVDLAMFEHADVQAARDRLGLREGQFCIGYVGNYPMTRGGRELIDAVAAADDPNWRGVIVGDGGDAERCREYARERGVDRAIQILGALPYESIPAIMPGLDVGLSLKTGCEQGSSELKVRQYLACGVPVVGSPGSNDFLVGEEFARVVDPECTEEIVAAIRDLQNRSASGGSQSIQSQAKSFARTQLSIESRNEARLRYWRNALRHNGGVRAEASGSGAE